MDIFYEGGGVAIGTFGAPGADDEEIVVVKLILIVPVSLMAPPD